MLSTGKTSPQPIRHACTSVASLAATDRWWLARSLGPAVPDSCPIDHGQCCCRRDDLGRVMGVARGGSDGPDECQHPGTQKRRPLPSVFGHGAAGMLTCFSSPVESVVGSPWIADA